MRDNYKLAEKSMLSRLVAFFTGCGHGATTFPQTKQGRTYVVCLDCGKEMKYDWEKMNRV